VMNKDYLMTDLLIEWGADKNLADDEGYTPVLACCQNGALDILSLLHENGGEIDYISPDGMGALSVAAKNGQSKIIKYLCDNGLDVNYNKGSSVNPYFLAERYNHEHTMKILKDCGAKPPRDTEFDKITLGWTTNWNTNDFLTGVKVGLQESRYKFGFEIGYETRLTPKRVLVKTSDRTYYQYWEKRYNAFFRINKDFPVIKNGLSTSGITINPRLVFSYGDYKGTRDKPANLWLPTPSAGWYWQQRNGMIGVYYEYLKCDIYNISNHRIFLEFDLIINTKFKYHPNKKSSNIFPINLFISFCWNC